MLSGLLVLLWAGVGAVAQAPERTETAAPAEAVGHFADVPQGLAYQPAIDALHEAEVIGGYFEDGHWVFKPGNPVLRAQFAKMICGALAIPVSEGSSSPFADLEPNDTTDLYPNHYVAAVAARGITLGTGPAAFSPWNNVTRAQLITMTVRAAGAVAPGLLTEPPAEFAG